jgi:NAD(P)-dependent dehydrogenase (short-subunit alcohol dehydrogenase family)
VDLGLNGRRVIVTGASRGIGAATAVSLSAEGARCALVARDRAALEGVAATLRHDPVVVVGDLATAAGVEASIEAAVAGLGGLDALVNNAGSSPGGSLEQVTDEQWQETFDLKLMGYVRGMRAAIPHLRRAGGGRIVNVGGTAGIRATEGYVLAAFIPALVHVTRTTAELVGRDGITVTLVHPGPTLTDRLRTMLRAGAERAGVPVEDFARDVVAAQLPLGRLGTPEEVARVVTVLCSDVAGWVSGGGILVDGGAARGVVAF